ncbi:MAG TPA: DUF1573 domain-containing protein [Bacteroidia bacterium]|nr:DUF1573 domain-containing protein [Bacteroidia bacterium]
MKKTIYSIILFMAIGMAAIAQDDKAAPAAPAATESNDPNAPEITFESDIHDFGTLEFGGNGVYNFKFTNTGKSPLIISNARGSCGCTVPKWSKEPIKKGEAGEINVSYDTKRPGPFTKTVTITSNAKTASKVITIKGVVQSQEETESTTPFKKDAGTPLENTSHNN